MKKMSTFVFLATMLVLTVSSTLAQTRIAVLPFQNNDGKYEYNVWCYSLQDSLTQALKAADPDEANYRVVPVDSLEIALAEYNLDPSNPQYFTDMWKAITKLNIKKVISGSFVIEGGSILIKAALYDVRLKLPHPKYQAPNLFKNIDEAYEAIDEIVLIVRPGIM